MAERDPWKFRPYTFCLDSAELAEEAWSKGSYREYFPGFFVFGNNGAGEYIALDLRDKQPWPVVALDMTNIDLADTVLPIAVGFSSFIELVGFEAADA